jgi:hypothetical protein
MRKETVVVLRAAPIVADGLALLLLLFWLRPLAARLQDQSSLNVLWLGGAYILLWLGVYVIRKLEPAAAAPALTWTAPRVRGALGILFGLAMMTAVAWQLGFFDVALTIDPMELGEGEAASFFVFAPSAWLGLSLFYVIVLAFNVTPTIGRGAGNYPWLALAGLLGVNAMLLLATAQLRAIAASIVGGGRLFWFAAAFLTLLLLFGPPRLLYLSRQPRLSAAVTFLVLVAYCAWRISA